MRQDDRYHSEGTRTAKRLTKYRPKKRYTLSVKRLRRTDKGRLCESRGVSKGLRDEDTTQVRNQEYAP